MLAKTYSLALGGGGARGVAHIGALAELERSGLLIERIVGTSMGALVGAMYAFEPDAGKLRAKALDYLLSPEFATKQVHLLQLHPRPTLQRTIGSWYQEMSNILHGSRLMMHAMRRPSFLPATMLEDVVEHLLPDADIADAKIPLAIATVDLISGREVVLQKGSVRRAVQASSSLPGIFPPVAWDDKLLSDLGVLIALPVATAHRLADDPVIAIDVSPPLRQVEDHITSLNVLMRTIEIGEVMTREPLRRLADILITPQVGGVQWYDFSQAVKVIEWGQIAAAETLNGLIPVPQTMIQKFWNWLGMHPLPPDLPRRSGKPSVAA